MSHRFLIASSQFKNDTVVLNEKESHHALTVLRLKAGDAVELFDGEGQSAGGVITGQMEGRVRVRLEGERLAHASGMEVTLGISVIKPERMEWLIEKSVELGAFAILPLLTDRTVVRISADRWVAKLQRWKKIAQETCKQCGQTRLPKIEPLSKFPALLKNFASYDLVLIPTLAEKSASLPGIFKEFPSALKILVLIGPEGDFSLEEIAAAQGAGARAVTLGDLTFRSETAALFMLSVLRHQTTL